MKLISEKHLSLAVFILLCLIWSSTWMVIKIGLESLPPFLSAGLRFLTAFLILLIYAQITKIRIPFEIKKQPFFILFGLLNFWGGYAFVYWGEQYIGSGLASVLFSVMPFYILFLSARLLPDERITLKKLFGVIIGFCGVIIIFWDQLVFNSGNTLAIIGMFSVLLSPLFSSFGTIMAKKAAPHYHPIAMTTIPMLYGSISFLILALIFEQNSVVLFDAKAIFSILYLALVGTSIAFVLYFWMLKTKSAVIMSMITFITPPLALIWGWAVLGEQITHFLIAGLILIFSGIALVRKR